MVVAKSKSRLEHSIRRLDGRGHIEIPMRA